MQRRSAVLLLLVAALALAPPALAAGYSIYPGENAEVTDTPTRTVELEGNEFDISSFARVDYGESAVVPIDAPEEEYNVYLYNTDRQPLWSSNDEGYGGPYTGNFDVPIPTDELSPGTYVIMVQGPSDQAVAVHPIVVQGYDIDLDAPTSLDAGETGELSVSLSPTGSSGDPASVDVALANESWERTIDTEGSDGTYEATFSVSSPGDYYVYAAARGTDTAYGQREALAITASEPLSVEEPTTTTATATTTTRERNGDNDATTESTTTAEPTTTATAESTTTAEPSTTVTESTTTTTTTEPTTTATTTEPTTDSVITPNAGGNATTTTASEGTPGFTVALTLLALSLTAVAALRGDRF